MSDLRLPERAASVPFLGEFNAFLLDAVAGFAPGGGYVFAPAARRPGSPINPRDPEYDGVETDIYCGGERVARARADGGTYCCGVTFEAFARAWTAWSGRAGVADLEPVEVRALVADWFCPTMGHSGVVSALASRGLGVEIAGDEAEAGDLCQFWRRSDLANPSGHSVVFLGFGVHNGQRSLEYWSSQPATDGVGFHSEVIGADWTVHLVRVGAPRSR